MDMPRRVSAINLRRKRTPSEGSNVSAGGIIGVKRKRGDKYCGVWSLESVAVIKYSVVWTVYVLIGSYVFLLLERTPATVTMSHPNWAKLKDLANGGSIDAFQEFVELKKSVYDICHHSLLEANENNIVPDTHHDAKLAALHNFTADHIAMIEQECGEALSIVEDVTSTCKWSYVDAIYYTMTHVTTIGYGHIAPTTTFGRIFAILYAVVGVPLTCILMATTSNILAVKLLALYNRLKNANNCDAKQAKVLLRVVILVYLVVGCVIFMFLPSAVFSYMEEWTYDEAFYYTFITLSTIGFGDYIGGYTRDYSYPDLYKICIIIWIMVALGYWVLLLNFLQKALKKKIVPKKIRVQFKAKQLAKQAEFLKQLMSKVREPDDFSDSAVGCLMEEQRKAMILTAEVAGILDKDSSKTRAAIRKQSLAPPRPHSIVNPHSHQQSSKSSSTTTSTSSCDSLDDVTVMTTVRLDDSVEEGNVIHELELPPTTNHHHASSVSLADLLSANVVVRTTKVPFINSLMEHSKKMDANNTVINIDGEPCDRIKEENKEVTLPLKEVLGIVTLVASLEKQVEGRSIQNDISVYSTIHNMVSMDRKVPVLREAFKHLQTKTRHVATAAASHTAAHKHPIGYKPVDSDLKNKLHKRKASSALNEFLDHQTKKEYVVVGEENDDDSDEKEFNAKMNQPEVSDDEQEPELDDEESDAFIEEDEEDDSMIAVTEDKEDSDDDDDDEEEDDDDNSEPELPRGNNYQLLNKNMSEMSV